MTEQEFYQELLAELDRAAESDKQLASLLEKIQSGQADFADSAAYWQKFSELIGSVLSQNAAAPGSGLNEEVSYLMLKNGHMRACEIMSMVQKALDQKQNIHISPIHPKFPEERTRQAAHSLEDTTVSEEVIRRRAENAIANIANTFHDDYIQENAQFRQKAGLTCRVSRIGASKCCAWCAEVAGRYSVGSEPADFWRRHDNCTCKISYENQRVRQQLSGNGKAWAVTSEIQRRRAQAVQYKPTVLTPEQAQTLEQQNLSRFRGLTIAGKTDIIESEGVKPMIRAIEQPIEQQHTGKGNPNAILQFGTALNNRQASLLKMLPEFDSRAIVPKDAVNMADLSALTAFTGDEFAMFTLKGNRLIIRGNVRSVNVDIETAKELAKQGYRWSGHTHPGMDFLCMQPSDGDYEILNQFHQENSVIYNSKGEFRTFERRGESDV